MRDESDPEHPVLVYGFVARDDAEREGTVRQVGEWDVLGMRATRSENTELLGALIRPERVARRVEIGDGGDALVFAINANFQLLIASVYTGLASRALAVGAEGLRRRVSKKFGTSYAEIPEYRARFAEAALRFEAVPPQLDAYTRDFDALVDYGPGWFRRFVGAKLRATEVARRTVEDAMRLVGGAGFGNSAELSRLYRDALAGMFHPGEYDQALPLFAAQYLDAE